MSFASVMAIVFPVVFIASWLWIEKMPVNKNKED